MFCFLGNFQHNFVNYDGFHFSTSMVQGGNFFMIIDIAMACDQFSLFLGLMWENTAPGTEHPRIFCAWISLLQLSIGLVCFPFRI